MQDYYSITSDMLTDSMLAVAAENLETKMNIIAEEQRCLNRIEPLHIWISRCVSLKNSNSKKHKYVNVLFSPTFPALSTQPATSSSPICSLLRCSPMSPQSASTYWTWRGMRRDCGGWGWRQRTWHSLCSIKYSAFIRHTFFVTISEGK